MVEKKISVCMAVHNGLPYLRQQLESILTQLHDNDELIISDDGSNDGSIDFIKNINDNRIKLLKLKKEKQDYGEEIFFRMKKIADNFENSISSATGDIIVFSDQDDIWVSDKLEYIRENMVGDCFIHDGIVINNKGETIGKTLFALLKKSSSFFNMFYKPPFVGCCMAVSKKIIDIALPFPHYPIEYDTYIGFCSKIFGRIQFSNKHLIIYRRHGNNASSCFEGSKNSIYIKIKRRFFMFKSYIGILKKLIYKKYFNH